MSIFIDLTLAQRLEGSDVEANVEYARTHARLFPEQGAATLDVAGGHAIFAGVDSPLTQAVGLGLGAPVKLAELNEMEDFFRHRGAGIAIEVCPLADASLLHLLNSRGYRLDELTDKMFRPLEPGEEFEESGGDVRVRLAQPAEAELWARTVGSGFADGGEVPALFLDIFRTSFEMPGHYSFLAELDGQVVGGATLGIYGETAELSGTSTLPAWRHRGAQSALIRARLAYAAARGCDLATFTARTNTASHRNAERYDFRVAYTRPKLVSR